MDTPSRDADRVFLFGPFRLDEGAAELRRGAERVDLRPKCFDLLLMLVKNPGKLLTREQLFEALWSDVVVSDATLSRTIAELRDALGDEDDTRQYIETVTRRGYKFIAAVNAAPLTTAASTGFFLLHGSHMYPLREGEHIVGRAEDVSVPLMMSKISRHHARVVVANGVLSIEDLDSRNGTYVNGIRIVGKQPLQPGDEIRIGGQTLVVGVASDDTTEADSRTFDPNR